MSSPLLKAKSDPRRLTVRATPKDSAISLFLNQRASMALWATTRGSAPAPKMNRPRNISGIDSGLPDDDRAGEDEDREDDAGLARPEPVDEDAAEEEDQDGGDAVHRVEGPDGRPGWR